MIWGPAVDMFEIIFSNRELIPGSFRIHARST
jgi:hypothetical protein